MAFNDIETKRYNNLLKAFLEGRRPPVEIRDQVDLAYRITKNSIEIFEIRLLLSNSEEKIEVPIAKTTYIMKNKVWKVYWQMADLKWHEYEPVPEVDLLEEFVKIVDEDEYRCFWG